LDLEQLGDFLRRPRRDPAVVLGLDEVQRREQHGALLRVLRELGDDPLSQLFRQNAHRGHRSHSPPIMLIMSKVGITSASICPWIMGVRACVLEKLGERARSLYGLPEPSLTM